MKNIRNEAKSTIVEYIDQYYSNYRAIPSVRDIAAGTGISVSTVHRCLKDMKENGELEYRGRRSVSTQRTQHRFRVLMDAVPLQPDMYTAVSVGFAALILTFLYFLSKFKIFRRNIHPFDIIIVATSGYSEEPAHFADRIFIRMTVSSLSCWLFSAI